MRPQMDASMNDMASAVPSFADAANEDKQRVRLDNASGTRMLYVEKEDDLKSRSEVDVQTAIAWLEGYGELEPSVVKDEIVMAIGDSVKAVEGQSVFTKNPLAVTADQTNAAQDTIKYGIAVYHPSALVMQAVCSQQYNVMGNTLTFKPKHIAIREALGLMGVQVRMARAAKDPIRVVQWSGCVRESEPVGCMDKRIG